MNSVSSHFNSQRMGRIVMQAMEEILGHKDVDVILDLALPAEYRGQVSSSRQEMKFPFERISHLQTFLEHAYGPQAGRGLSMRIGRACLKYSLREFGSGLGIVDLPFRLLPLPARIRVGCEALTDFINQFFDQQVSLELDKRYIFFHFAHCPHCGDGQFISPLCAMEVGFLQEALNWVSAGKYFLVEEQNCILCGDTKCTIVIDQTPLS
jgi:predicted hydrocarbon binding protein